MGIGSGRARRWLGNRRAGWHARRRCDVQQRGLFEKGVAHLLAGLEAFVGIFSQSFANDPVDAPRKSGIDERRRHRIFVHDLIEDGRDISPKGFFASHKLVENRAQREDVGAMVNLFARHLFGSHVAGCAHHQAGLRERRILDLGYAKIQDLDDALLSHHEIGRLQIAVNYAASVSKTDPSRNLVGPRDEGRQRRHANVGQ